MLTLSILWVLLAAAVIVVALNRRPTATGSHAAHVKDSGKALEVLAALYSLALLAGFLYVSRFLVSSL